VLTSITITVTGEIDGTITLTNNSTSSQTATGSTSSTFTVEALSGFSFSSPLFTASLTTGSQLLTAGQSKTFSGLTSGTDSGMLTNSALFGPYIGGSFFDVFVDTLTGISITGGGGNIAGAQSTTAQAGATVDYEYRIAGPTPEPATFSMLGLGLLACGFVARKFQR
jgi:hypothetical protein